MDHHVWQLVYQTIKKANKSIPQTGRKPMYSDTLIIGMYAWSVAHDRPLCWACRRENYNSWFRPRRLPSVSQFCKRIKSPRCDAILESVHRALAPSGSIGDLSFLDGRALRVGPYSKDAEATRGYCGGAFAKGYKLHAWATTKGFIPVWSVMPLNVNEKKVASELIQHARPYGLILADKNYDAGYLYDDIAECGGQLITPLPKNAGGGHRHQSSSRLSAAAAWRGIAGYVYRDRIAIERFFGQMSSYGGGLGPLPTWVRTLPRVRRWVGTKLILYHARLLLAEAVS